MEPSTVYPSSSHVRSVPSRCGLATSRNSHCSAIQSVVVSAISWKYFRDTFPALTGRIVDRANVIPVETLSAIEQKLIDLETKSGIQFVVATVGSLEGLEIEPYANELFRSWKLGEKTKNNGVLLLVAPNEKRVRIEVGYGLEGTLTDALSKIIITNAIAPRFKMGDFGDGISRGIDDIWASGNETLAQSILAYAWRYDVLTDWRVKGEYGCDLPPRGGWRK